VAASENIAQLSVFVAKSAGAGGVTQFSVLIAGYLSLYHPCKIELFTWNRK